MKLKGSEKFVAEALKKHFSKDYKYVEYRSGENPPDIYLTLEDKEIPVEISDINENTIKNNTGTTRGYLALEKTLEKELGKLIKDEMVIFIDFYHFNTKANKIKNELIKKLKKLLTALKVSDSYEGKIKGLCFKVTAMKSTNTRKVRVSVSSAGMLHKKSRDKKTVTNLLGDFNLEKNTYNLIAERLETKNKKCSSLLKPIWLALNDEYYDIFSNYKDTDHINHYKKILGKVSNFGSFEKIFIIFKNEDIFEYKT